MKLMVDIGKTYTFVKQKAEKPSKSFVSDAGTAYRFLVVASGEYIAQRLIPVHYIGAA